MSLSDSWFNRLVVGGVAFGFILLVAVGIMATSTILENQQQTQWVNHTYKVERGIARWRVLEERVEAARRGLLLRRDPALSSTFSDTAAQIAPALDSLRALTVDNPRQQRNVELASRIATAHLESLRESVALALRGRRDEAIASFNQDASLPLIRTIRTIAERMTDEEDRLLAIRNAEQHRSIARFYVTLALAGMLLLVVAVGSIWIIIRYTRDLTRSRDRLHLLNEDLEGAVRERTVDLQRANDEIQRFAYIVSHDLRSPLVNVMGFTAELEASATRLGAMMDRVEEQAPDLIDKDARLAAREDLPEAIGFIRTSTQKMDRLINAILRLSREGRRPITPERLDMDALVQGISDTIHHRVEELGAEIVIAPDLPDIVSDRLAVEQILGNIVENAVKYLKPGVSGRVEVRGRKDGTRAIFEIVDNGRGIDQRDHDRIFDLFRRSGKQDQPGEGIGLAHTRALAYRLGGTIGVESELGRGATFRVNLPVTYSGEQRALT